jgi:hypothetical protein
MNNRYKYNNRRRNYGNKDSGTNGASSIVTLVFLLIVLLIWIISLKSDIRNVSDRNFEIKRENDSLMDKIDSLLVIPEPKEIVVIPEMPKKVFKRIIKDTTTVKVVEKIETKPIVVDSTGL